MNLRCTVNHFLSFFKYTIRYGNKRGFYTLDMYKSFPVYLEGVIMKYLRKNVVSSTNGNIVTINLQTVKTSNP